MGRPPQPKEDREELLLIVQVLTQLLRPGIGVRHLWGGKTSGDHKLRAECKLDYEFLLEQLRCFRMTFSNSKACLKYATASRLAWR